MPPPDPTAIQTAARYRPIEQLVPSNWSQGEVVANGIRQYYYRTGGDKPPLVLLHGFMEGALAWLRAARALEQHYDVIMLDARGHGRSERIENGFTQELLTADVAGAIRALGLKKTGVLGFSQGAATGVHLADTHRDLVSSLIAEGAAETSNPATDFTQSDGYQKWLSTYTTWLAQLKTQTHAERMISALSQLQPGAPIPSEDEYVTWVENCARLDLSMVALGASLWGTLGARASEYSAALKRVTCPVLVLKSSFFPEPGAPKSMQDEPSDQPNVKIIRFVNTGHRIHQERFAWFTGTVRGFFGGVDKIIATTIE